MYFLILLFKLYEPSTPSHETIAYLLSLGKYGITGDTALQTLNTLSGGQKSRVVFAQAAYSPFRKADVNRWLIDNLTFYYLMNLQIT